MIWDLDDLVLALLGMRWVQAAICGAGVLVILAKMNKVRHGMLLRGVVAPLRFAMIVLLGFVGLTVLKLAIDLANLDRPTLSPDVVFLILFLDALMFGHAMAGCDRWRA